MYKFSLQLLEFSMSMLNWHLVPKRVFNLVADSEGDDKSSWVFHS